jgi:hypothetical protein
MDAVRLQSHAVTLRLQELSRSLPCALPQWHQLPLAADSCTCLHMSTTLHNLSA